MKLFVGIDNGTTGAIGIISDDSSILRWIKTPIKTELSYTKSKKVISRINYPELIKLLKDEVLIHNSPVTIVLERPLINPKLFSTSMSAMRSLESTLIALEELKIPYSYIDSKSWQKILLPSGLKGKELKDASKQIGKRLFPKLEFGNNDCDAILIAEYARRNNL